MQILKCRLGPKQQHPELFTWPVMFCSLTADWYCSAAAAAELPATSMALVSASAASLKTMLVVASPVKAVARVILTLTVASLGTRPAVFAPCVGQNQNQREKTTPFSVNGKPNGILGCPGNIFEPCKGHIQALNGSPVRLLVGHLALWAAAIGGAHCDCSEVIAFFSFPGFIGMHKTGCRASRGKRLVLHRASSS